MLMIPNHKFANVFSESHATDRQPTALAPTYGGSGTHWQRAKGVLGATLGPYEDTLTMFQQQPLDCLMFPTAIFNNIRFPRQRWVCCDGVVRENFSRTSSMPPENWLKVQCNEIK